MITKEQYFGKWLDTADALPEYKENAEILVESVNKLMEMAEADGVVFHKNPKTGSCVSGNTFGGFRPRWCKQGKKDSAHKEGEAVDIFDPDDKVDDWCMANLDKLEQCGIYLEHPSATVGWSHWGTRAPKSRKRVYYP